MDPWYQFLFSTCFEIVYIMWAWSGVRVGEKLWNLGQREDLSRRVCQGLNGT